jgi:hypothetical protein
MPTMRCTFPLLRVMLAIRAAWSSFTSSTGGAGLAHPRSSGKQAYKKSQATAQQAPDGPPQPDRLGSAGRQSTECFVSQLGSMTADTKFSISVCAISRLDRPGTLPEAMLSRRMSAT